MSVCFGDSNPAEAAFLANIAYRDASYLLSDPEFNSNYQLLNSQEVGNDVVHAIRNKATGELYVAIRGTDSLISELIDYSNLYTGQVTSGAILAAQVARNVSDFYGGAPVVVTGHSYGGHAALEVARLAPEVVAYAHNFQGPTIEETILEVDEFGQSTQVLTPLGSLDTSVPTFTHYASDPTFVNGVVQSFGDRANTTFIDIPVSEHSAAGVAEYYEQLDSGAAVEPPSCDYDFVRPWDAGFGVFSDDLPLFAAFLAKIVTPLVIDMDGDGVELVSLADSTAFFDLNIDGYAELTGWVASDDALLALDVDEDGIIDDNSELFGNQTGFANGFLALAAHDANADGVIDANDAVYADLIVWQDLDGDGFSNASEMMGLADAGIVSISLNSTSTDFTNQGHWVSDVSTVTWGDGTNTSIEDVHFENDTRASVALLPDDFQYHVDAFKLPVLFGYGQIASTWVVLSQDATLRADAEALLDLLAVGNVSGFMTAFEDYLLAWADVDHIDPDSRNTNIHGTQTGMDARHLTFLEKAYGQGYIQKWWDGPGGYSDPHHLAARQLTAQFEDLVEMLAGRFIAQSATSTALMAATTQTEFDTLFNAHLFSELTGLVAGYSPSNRGLEGDLQPVLDSLVGSIQSGEVAPEEAARLFYIMHHDMEPDATLFSDQLRNLADINGAAEAYMLSEGVRALADGHQLAFGTSGDDILSTNDYGLIVGGKGNDTLSGGAEADLYIYTSGDGSDVIEDAERFHSRTDRLVFTDLTLDQVTFGQNSSRDLVITLPDNETVTIAGHFAYGLTGGTGYEMELIEFAYGTVLDTHQIRQKSVADQKVTGAVSGTRLSENYIHTQGDGSYTITDLGINSFHDSLTFTDVNAEDAKFSKTAHMDLRIELPNGEIITVVDHFRNGLSGLNYAYEIEKIVFADGTELNTQDIRLKSIADQKASGDVLGTEVAETYSHSQGDGSYTITDFSSQTSQIDRLEFTDVDAADVLFSKNSDKDLIITLANGETITVIDHFLANHTGRFSYQIEQVTFSDGTVLDLQRIADKVDADLFAGGGTSGGQDQTGTPGADNYAHVLGDGSYTITDESSSPSTIDRLTFLDVTATDVAFDQNAGGDLVITLSNGETVTITDHFASTHYDMEEIAFADGTVYTPDDILNLI